MPNDTIFEMGREEFVERIKEAVANREAVPSMPYAVSIDRETGKLTKSLLVPSDLPKQYLLPFSQKPDVNI